MKGSDYGSGGGETGIRNKCTLPVDTFTQCTYAENVGASLSTSNISICTHAVIRRLRTLTVDLKCNKTQMKTARRLTNNADHLKPSLFLLSSSVTAHGVSASSASEA